MFFISPKSSSSLTLKLSFSSSLVMFSDFSCRLSSNLALQSSTISVFCSNTGLIFCGQARVVVFKLMSSCQAMSSFHLKPDK